MTSAPTMAPIHPGEILVLEYIEPLGITQHRVAIAIGVPPRRINEIVYGKRGITANTALRLARYFGTSERFWVNLQSRYELEVERDRLAGTLDQIERSAPTLGDHRQLRTAARKAPASSVVRSSMTSSPYGEWTVARWINSSTGSSRFASCSGAWSGVDISGSA